MFYRDKKSFVRFTLDFFEKENSNYYRRFGWNDTGENEGNTGVTRLY